MTSPRTAKKLPDPGTMRWTGTAKSAQAISDWARDDALLPYAQPVAPDRNAAEGAPEASWSLRLLVPVDPNHGGGTQWVVVPPGATIVYGGDKVDPVFSIRNPAETFSG